MLIGEIGQSIPPNTAHAVSVSLPTWKANIGYEEGEDWVLSKMMTGYPRFYIHKCIANFAEVLAKKYGSANDQAMLFPSIKVALRCIEFLRVCKPGQDHDSWRVIELVSKQPPHAEASVLQVVPKISAVIFPKEDFKFAKTFWQHSGEGISSRRAEFCHKAYTDGVLIDVGEQKSLRETANGSSSQLHKGPKRYRRASGSEQDQIAPQMNGSTKLVDDEAKETTQFIEERFGRNLDLAFVNNAKLAIRRRIAGSLTADVELKEAVKLPEDREAARKVSGFSEDDVYLYPTGMSSIFNSHRIFMIARGQMKSICFGFPYIDTLKILQKFGPGCVYYGHGSSADLDDLEERLRNGERFLALFCEFPGNPLLKSPDLLRIRALADKYTFGVVVDETVGNFMNVNVLPHADIVVSSLTKVFSGDSNVMGGSAVLNPRGQFYKELRRVLAMEYEDNYWAEDSLFMERNSRDFVSRIERINTNAEAISETLKAHHLIKQVYYPKTSLTRPNYEQCRNENGGYGGLLSVTFFRTADAVVFFDRLETAKGPSLGTNFTLSSPYTLLAHYGELEWAAQFGVEADLVRISVGLEDTMKLKEVFQRALNAVECMQSGDPC